ncbi:MAG: phosphoribosyltransferase domain-containing protein [Bacillota bacterium]|nr:phosphoribosyltransferase domain-containing protein [Bacillota bacterium]
MLYSGTDHPYMESGGDGFVVVKRRNNPLREFAMVHQCMGKIGAVHPAKIIDLVKEMGNLVSLSGEYPIMGLSESSILIGRIFSEVFGGPFIFSTRYPVPGMMSFSEPHSHAPAQFLNLSSVRQSSKLCIVEDEITTGNTAMNLIRALTLEMPNLSEVTMIALKSFVSSERLSEMQKCADAMGIRFSLHCLYQEPIEENEPLNICDSEKPENSVSFDLLAPELEKGRGRVQAFSPQQGVMRYEMWGKALGEINLPSSITVIGASEAIDMAFEISYMLYLKGYDTELRHFTISPWELPCWSFHGSQIRSMYLYMPPGKADRNEAYILVYDQLFQEIQVKELAARLQKMGARVYLLSNIKGEIQFINVEK